ncbi:uncharacterized protein LOC110918710 isoform X4 [Helianthus annuus]|uniref:uncharacterized protein LOC110918710 isoform X4 n=1 Tax=Helianthus annuus TaxID=4232 RepID=UPI0016530794|nr:uncharacterized protein LOC110918710 isoform X4 [Helianthus annuus]
MSWRRIAKSLQAFCAHTSLFSFTLLLVLKLDHHIFSSWWIVFSPLFVFHLVIARGRFSLPAPSTPQNRHWAPCHSVVGMALLVAFELLLCVFLESVYVMKVPAVSLKIVFLPLLAFELIILVDNVRMCKALLPVNEEHLTDEAIWETLPHFWISISMIFFIAATLFTLLKLCAGDVGTLGWWDLFINFGIAECFAFLVCTNWSNPTNHRNHQSHYASTSSSSSSSSSSNIRYLDWNSGLLVSSNNIHMNRVSRLQYAGGHITKVPVIVFQILLCMHLEKTPAAAGFIPLPIVFSPLLVLQGAGVVFSASKLVDECIKLPHTGPHTGRLLDFSSETHDCFGFLYGGSRLIGWWYTDEESREEQARLYHAGATGYNTFCGYPPEVVKKMPKKALTEEVCRLQAALCEHTEITIISQQEYETLQNEKVLCRVCYERELSVVLLPCRHWVLCSKCSEKCKKCPICRVNIDERLLVHDT